MHTSPIANGLSCVILGPALPYRNLAMFPLLKRAGDTESRTAGDYTLLDEALGTGAVEITEVSEQGRVPELRVVNRGPKPTLIVDGEELVGAKQNRVVNLTILVPAHSELTIPVSCVEAGRWRARSRTFASAPRTQYATGRAKRMAHVTASIQKRRAYASNQSEVWADIAEKSARLRAKSSTGAMEALFVEHVDYVDEYVAACRPVDDQIGALFTIDGAVIGFDLFDSERTLRKLLPKLVRAVAVDALDSDGRQPTAFRYSSLKSSDLDNEVRAQQFIVAVSPRLGRRVRLSARASIFVCPPQA